MSNYYAVLHDGDPGPSHLDNILSERHEDFIISAYLLPNKVVVRSSFKLNFTLARAPRGPLRVTVWDGPIFLYVVFINAESRHLIEGNILNVDLTWTQEVETICWDDRVRAAPEAKRKNKLLPPAWLTRRNT